MAPDTRPMPSDVAAVFGGYPKGARDMLLPLRDMIFDVASETQSGPLTETLKWGQPSYLTERTRSGTTLRLGWSEVAPDVCGLYVHCSTDLIERFRDLTGETLRFSGRRAILIGLNETPDPDALRVCIAATLTYHRNKGGAGKKPAVKTRAEDRSTPKVADHG